MSLKLHSPLTLDIKPDINPTSPPLLAHSPLDITADINPPFFLLLVIALCAGVSPSRSRSFCMARSDRFGWVLLPLHQFTLYSNYPVSQFWMYQF
jgi:hypothetical protein